MKIVYFPCVCVVEFVYSKLVEIIHSFPSTIQSGNDNMVVIFSQTFTQKFVSISSPGPEMRFSETEFAVRRGERRVWR